MICYPFTLPDVQHLDSRFGDVQPDSLFDKQAYSFCRDISKANHALQRRVLDALLRAK